MTTIHTWKLRQKDTIPCSLTVCIPCKRRKKGCDKGLPSCSRCNRLDEDCFYTEETPSSETQTSSLSSMTSQPSSTFPGLLLQNGSTNGCKESEASRLRGVAARLKPDQAEHDFDQYIQHLHPNLPIINLEDYSEKCMSDCQDSHFFLLKLAVSLFAHPTGKHKCPEIHTEGLYHMVKDVFMKSLSSCSVSVDLILAGVLLACHEFCQAQIQQSWLTIGNCVKVAQLYRLQRKSLSHIGKAYESWWWCIIVLERIIGAEFMDNQLPLSSDSPALNDSLPVLSLNDVPGRKVNHDLYIVEKIDDNDTVELRTCSFTTLSAFATTIQATYLYGLVRKHVLDGSKDRCSRKAKIRGLDLTLQAYAGALIPPPGQAAGHFCGAYGLRTCAFFYLHEHELEGAIKAGDIEQATLSLSMLQSTARTVIHGVHALQIGKPMDLESLAFWAHKNVYKSASIHIKYGIRNPTYDADLEICKKNLAGIGQNLKLCRDFLHELEREEVQRQGDLLLLKSARM